MPSLQTISDGRSTVQKIILVQAKLGHLTDMDTSESDFLKEQLRKMKHLVEAPKVMEIPEFSGRRYPQIVSGNNFLDDQLYTPMDLPDYFVARVTTTLDGCTDPEVISTVQDSSLTRLHVDARLKQKT